MRVLLVGAGGVGGSIALIAARRTFFEAMVVADYDTSRAVRVAESASDPRFIAAHVDASDTAAVVQLLVEHRCDVLVNATDPRFVMPCLLYTSDAADEEDSVDLGGRRIIKKKK